MRVLEEGTAEKREHPLDREYRRLECSIQLMAESDPMFQVDLYYDNEYLSTLGWWLLRKWFRSYSYIQRSRIILHICGHIPSDSHLLFWASNGLIYAIKLPHLKASNWDIFVQGLSLSDSAAGHPWIPGGLSRADARLVPPSTPTRVLPRQSSRERSVPLRSRKCVSYWYFLLVEVKATMSFLHVLCLQLHSTLLWHGTRLSNLAGILNKGLLFPWNCSRF